MVGSTFILTSRIEYNRGGTWRPAGLYSLCEMSITRINPEFEAESARPAHELAVWRVPLLISATCVRTLLSASRIIQFKPVAHLLLKRWIILAETGCRSFS